MTPGPTFCGFYGRDNLGDEAILEGLIDLWATARPGEKPLAISAKPDATRREHGIEAVHAYDVGAKLPVPTTRLARAVLTRSHFVLGGGDLLRDAATTDVVGMWLSRLELAQRLRRRTAVIGISVGDLWKPASKARIRATLSKTDLVVVRDAASRDALADLDVQAPLHVAPDLALRRFRPGASSTTDAAGASAGASLRIAVSVRGLSDRGAESGQAERRSHLVELAAALDELLDAGHRVELVPFRSIAGRLQPVDDDYVASLELAHLTRRGHELVVHRHVPTVAAVRELLAGMDVVVGMRLHSVIMAAGLGVPAVAIAYDRKVDAFCHEAGLDECLAGDAITQGALVAAIQRAGGRGRVAADPPALAAYRSGAASLEGLIGAW